MKGTMHKSGLLEYIAEKAGCGYLSDLHSKKRSYLIYKVIAEIAPSDYDLKSGRMQCGILRPKWFLLKTAAKRQNICCIT